MTEPSSTDHRALSNLAAALRIFQEVTKGSRIVASAASLQTLLAIALMPDRSVTELAKHFDLPNGSMSRLIADLSSVGRSGDPGLELVEQRPYPYDSRHSRNRLSVKGHSLVAKITTALTRQPVARAA